VIQISGKISQFKGRTSIIIYGMVIESTKNLYIWKHEYDVKKIF